MPAAASSAMKTSHSLASEALVPAVALPAGPADTGLQPHETGVWTEVRTASIISAENGSEMGETADADKPQYHLTVNYRLLEQ